MPNSVIFEERLTVPFVNSLAEFRAWALSPQFPQTGRIDYLAGQIEVDMSPKNLFFHGTLKSELARVIGNRVSEIGLGDFFIDRTRVSSIDGDVSSEPDIAYLSNDAIDSGRVKLIPTIGEKPHSYIELDGGPDLIVEIVSDSSVVKDTKRLPKLYFDAGVREFWLVDARKPELSFVIYRRGRSQFTKSAINADGFQKSVVLECGYRLERRPGVSGRPKYRLIESGA